MNKMTVNQDSGYLESANGLRAFSADKKAKFLQLAQEYADGTGKMPSIRALCESIGIALTTYERHYREDDLFKEGMREIKLKGKDILEQKMFEYAQNKGGYMHMITWLRKEFPEEYNPESRLLVQSDNKILIQAIEGSEKFVDAEIVPPSTTPPSLPPKP